MKNIVKHKLGYYTLKKKPSQEELTAYYQNKYFQSDSGNYRQTYSEAEKQYINNKLEIKNHILDGLLPKTKSKYLLDVGAGEGWGLAYFNSHGWHATGIDMSDFGCKSKNPSQLNNLFVGDIYHKLDELIEEKKKYHALIVDNLLEHVLDPIQLLKKLKHIINKEGFIIVTVPNDFSVLQRYLKHQKLIKNDYWICSPDHISYFNRESLHNLFNHHDLHVVEEYGDFPIELQLFSDKTNYVQHKNSGKSAHEIRVKTENFLFSQSIENTIRLYKEFLNNNLSRQITCFVKL